MVLDVTGGGVNLGFRQEISDFSREIEHGSQSEELQVCILQVCNAREEQFRGSMVLRAAGGVADVTCKAGISFFEASS